MSRRRLVLAPEHRRLLEAAARESAPEECCGILIGRHPQADIRVVTRVVRTENAKASHRERSYEIAPSELLAAWRMARAGGERILGFYHSHPSGSSRPSARDRVEAWSGMSYVIVAPADEACRLTSWRGEGDGGGLEREEIRGALAREVGG